LETKSIPLLTQDVDLGKRTAKIAHAGYNNIDRAKDISRKGMFKKSWEDGVDNISFYFNHDDTQAPGRVTGVSEDSDHAYTEVKMGTHTLGNDVLLMMDEGIIKKASFGYVVVKSQPKEIKGQKIRELLEVKHIETSVLTQLPANEKTRIVSVQKSMPRTLELKTLTDTEQSFLAQIIKSGSTNVRAALDLADTLDPDSDLYTWINYFIQQQSSWIGDAKSNLRWGRKGLESSLTDLKSHIQNMERFCRHSKASDDCIQNVEAELKAAQQVLSQFDTAITHDDEPAASGEDNATESEVLATIKLLTLKASLS
jgi:HK97 family phage prohead protease